MARYFEALSRPAGGKPPGRGGGSPLPRLFSGYCIIRNSRVQAPRAKWTFPALSRSSPLFFLKMLLLLLFHNRSVTSGNPFRGQSFSHYPQSYPHRYVNSQLSKKILLRRTGGQVPFERTKLSPFGEIFRAFFPFPVDNRAGILYDNGRCSIGNHIMGCFV